MTKLRNIFNRQLAWILLLVAISVLLYGLTLRGVEGNPEPHDIKATLSENVQPFELSPERGRFAHVMALADNGTYALSQELADFVYPDVGYRNGRFFSFFAPGMSYMAAPFYEFGKQFGLSQVSTFAFVSLVSILGLVVLYKICRDIFKMRNWSALFAVLTFAFATTSWSYAITLYQHHVTLFFMLLAFYSVWRYKVSTGSAGWIWGSVVWLCYGLAITVDYPNAILLLPVMFYFVFASFKATDTGESYRLSFNPALVLTFIFFVGITAFHFKHNQEYFGSWSKLSGELVSYKAIVENNLQSAPDPEEAAKNLEGEKVAITFFSEEKLPRGAAILAVSVERGLYFYAPILLLAIWGLIKAFRNFTIEYGTILFLIGVNLFLYSSWGDPWGGWAFGPRYLIPSMALFSIFVGFGLDSVKPGLWGRLGALVLFAYSAAVAVIGAVTSNAVPPKVEAVALNTGYSFTTRSWDYVMNNQSGSYMYNQYFSNFTLMNFALAIYLLIVLSALIILFVLPRYDHD